MTYHTYLLLKKQCDIEKDIHDYMKRADGTYNKSPSALVITCIFLSIPSV